DPKIEKRPDGTVLVTVPVKAKIDAAFRYTEVKPGAREEIVFQLTRDARNQWRISHLDDGVVMSPSNFRVLYRRVPLYFASSDGTQLVPDVRWFPNDNTATYAVSALLDGPSPWLRDGVRTGAPEGAKLSTTAVTVSTGLEASVDLSANVGKGADINLLQAQLEATLLRLPGVKSVAVSVGGVPWRADHVPDLARDVQPTNGPFLLQDDRLAVLDRGKVVPVEDAAPLTGLDARTPALSPDETVRVVLSGTTRLLLLPAGAAAPVTLTTGSHLVAPSVDRFGWTWTGEQTSTGQLTAVLPSGEVAVVGADLLNGRTIRSLRVARDGSRIAIAHTDAAGLDLVVDVAAVVRDETGRPQLLGETPLQVGAVLDDATELAWVDEATIAVLGRSGTISAPTVHLVPVGGPTETLPLMDRTSGIAAGRGDRTLFLADEDGVLMSRQSTSWVPTGITGVRDPVFPG
ncbi:MAG TPA: LpqB family beta-propeller domain-containing protein, partial [Actinotalea sp.]